MRVLPAIARFTLLATPLVVAGCPGSLENPERFVRSSQTDCKDVVPQLLEKTCAVAGCHAADTPAQGLDLESSDVASRLVGQSPTGPGCSGTLADPSDPTGSVFYRKLTSNPPCGERMPYLEKPISSAQLACVKEWIASLGGGNPPADAGTGAGGSAGGGSGGAPATSDGGSSSVNEDAGTPGDGTGLRGEYFDEKDFTNSKLVRVDPTVDFSWPNQQSPDPAIAADGDYSVRWTGFVTAEFDETYTFTSRSDDGSTLVVGGKQLFADATVHGAQDFSGTVAMKAGVPVPIRLDFINDGLGAEIHLSWSSPSQPKQIIPESRLSPPK